MIILTGQTKTSIKIHRIMKHCIILLLTLFTLTQFTCKAQFVHTPAIELGYCFHWNKLNEDNYLNFKYYSPSDVTLDGYNIKLVFPTEIKYIDLIIGSLIELNRGEYGSRSWTPGITSANDYKLNGGGVYFGISPKIKGKHFGLTSEFTIGVLSYKEYNGIFNNEYEPYVDEYIRKTSNGLGALSSIGAYVKFGRVCLNPSLQAIFSGGDQASFLFYGFSLPLSIQL